LRDFGKADRSCGNALDIGDGGPMPRELGAWGKRSLWVTPPGLPALGAPGLDIADDGLGAGLDRDVPDRDRLRAAVALTLKGQHSILKG
jgi:hypothetical protein